MSPLSQRPNVVNPLEGRIRRLVDRALQGAQLRQFRVTEQTETETIAVVIWKKGEEWGTHRACLTADSEMLVWGHFFLPPGEPVADAYRDYNKRIAGET